MDEWKEEFKRLWSIKLYYFDILKDLVKITWWWFIHKIAEFLHFQIDFTVFQFFSFSVEQPVMVAPAASAVVIKTLNDTQETTL